MPQDAVAVDYDGEDCGAADGDASMSERKIRRLVERVKSIEASNVRLHRRIENMRADDSALNQHNEQLMKQIHRLQQQLDSKTRKDPLRSLAGPVEIFANRTGDKFPKFYKERRQPWPGNGQEFGAAIDAMKQILAQIFDSVSDAMEFLNTSLTEHMTRAELRRGIQRLKIKNLDVEHVLWDLDRPDGLTIKMFIEAFEWKQPNGIFRNDSQFLIGSARENKPRIEAAVSEALGRNPQGWDAMKYMTRFRAVKQTERAKPQYDPATLIDIIEPKDVRLLSAREKFMIKAMQPPESGSLRPLKMSESPRQWTDRLASMGWKKNPEEEDAARALKLEFERSIQLQRRGPSTKSQTFTLDLSGLSSPQFPESVTFTSRPSTRVKVITPRHKLTDGFAFSEDSENVRRLMREHETIMTGRRPILSAVTSDHMWLKQNLLLAAVQRKEEEASREKARYDLDGRCYPTNSANNSIAEGADDNEMQISLDAAMKSGDRAELSAIMKRRSVELSLKSAARDPFTHASASNIAYMQVQQLSNSSLGTLISPRDDPSLMEMLANVRKEYPRSGSVKKTIFASKQNCQTVSIIDASNQGQRSSTQINNMSSLPQDDEDEASYRRSPRKKETPLTREEIKSQATRK